MRITSSSGERYLAMPSWPRAILDRFLIRAIVISIRGEGYRLREKRLGEQYDAAIRAEASAIKGGSIFLRSTAGTENGNKLSSVMAGVARSNLPQGSASATKSYTRSKVYATIANPYPTTS
jgi:hypothetical protein